jgi:hypothetical protein
MSPRDDLRDVFRELDPPPGGLAALRARIDARSRRGRWIALPALATAAAIVFAVVSRPAPAPLPWDPTLQSLGLEAPPAEPVTLPDSRRGDTALMRVETGTPGVTFYRVSVAGRG